MLQCRKAQPAIPSLLRTRARTYLWPDQLHEQPHAISTAIKRYVATHHSASKAGHPILVHNATLLNALQRHCSAPDLALPGKRYMLIKDEQLLLASGGHPVP